MTPSSDGRSGQPQPRGRRRRDAQCFLLVAVAVGLVLALAPGWGAVGLVGEQGQVTQAAEEAQAGEVVESAGALPSAESVALVSAWHRVEELGAWVQRKGGVVPSFGRKAEALIKQTVADAGVDPNGEEAMALEQALDAPLHVLFVRQLHTLLARSLDLYDAGVTARPNPLEAALAAEQSFLASAETLVRPGSGWSFEAEHKELLERMDAIYSSDNRILEERAKQGQGKQVAIQVIRKLQQQSEDVQKQVETRGAFPWNVKWQYFIEKSPVGFRGQYAQGRSVVELLLMPSPDPRYKNNLLNRIGPLNLAVAFDMLL